MKKPRTPAANGTSRLDVTSPGVNFLLKSDTAVLIMTGPPTDAIHGVNRLMRTSCPLSPLSISTFQENINTLRQTSRHDIPSTVGILCFWVYAKKLSCEILNLLQITHKKMNMGLYGKIAFQILNFFKMSISEPVLFL